MLGIWLALALHKSTFVPKIHFYQILNALFNVAGKQHHTHKWQFTTHCDCQNNQDEFFIHISQYFEYWQTSLTWTYRFPFYRIDELGDELIYFFILRQAPPGDKQGLLSIRHHCTRDVTKPNTNLINTRRLININNWTKRTKESRQITCFEVIIIPSYTIRLFLEFWQSNSWNIKFP